MKVLVTGGAGYKGIKLCKLLLEKGYEVTMLDNFMYGFAPALYIAENPNLTIIKHDIRNKIENLSKYDAIFHLAGISGFPACTANPAVAQDINVNATKQLVEGLSKDQILIYASTTSFYGKSGNVCTEETPIDAVSHYGRTKYEAEVIVSQKENSLSFRFATVFGFSPKMRMDLMVNDFTFKAVKEQMVVLFESYAKRTFIHVDDAAACYLFGLENFDKLKNEVYNAGADHLNYSKMDVALAIKKFVDFEIIDPGIKDKDLRHFIISFEKLNKKGFVPQKTIEQGIEEMLRIFKFYEYYTHYKQI